MTAAAKTFSVVDRIRTYRSQMPATMAKIAAVLIDDPRAPLSLSITELAERAGTSAASVTRFCRMIGYGGYSPLRVGIAEDVGRGGAEAAWLADIGRSFGPDDPPEEIKRALLNTHLLSLQTTAGLLDMPTALRVADAIAKSRHLDIYGVGGSALTALETKARLYRIGVNVHTWAEVHNGLTSAAIPMRSAWPSASPIPGGPRKPSRCCRWPRPPGRTPWRSPPTRIRRWRGSPTKC